MAVLGMSGPHVFVDAVVLRPPLGGALRYAMETLPRLIEPLQASGGQLSLWLHRDFSRNSTRKTQGGDVRAWATDWTNDLEKAGARLLWTDRPMHPAWTRWRTEGRELRAHLTALRNIGQPVDIVQTQSLPTPRFLRRHKLPGSPAWVHLCHGVRHLHAGRPLRALTAKRTLSQTLQGADVTISVSQALGVELLRLAPRANVRIVSPGSDHLKATSRTRQDWIFCPGPQGPLKNQTLVHTAMRQDPFLAPLLALPKTGTNSGANPLALHTVGTPIPEDVPEENVEGNAEVVPESFPFELPEGTTIESLATRSEQLDSGQMAEALATCAAVVLPSKLESFGIVALEAMNLGTPLALSDLPAHREVLGSAADHAHWFEPNDIVGCARAIRGALAGSSPEQESAFRFRANSYLWSRTAQETLAVWNAAMLDR